MKNDRIEMIIKHTSTRASFFADNTNSTEEFLIRKNVVL